ncbi:MAG: outer membrane beta-barrel protein [Pseudomonadota bacterium]
MKRALPLLALTLGLTSVGAQAADNAVIGSLYLPTVDVEEENGSPDALQVEFRHSLNRNVWFGGMLTTGFGEDALTPLNDVEVGNSLTLMIGAQTEFAHRVSGYAFLGYGKAEGSVTGPGGGDADGNGVAWGLGMDFGVSDNMLIDVAYVSLFDGDMDVDGVDIEVAIAGPRVGIGFTF